MDSMRSEKQRDRDIYSSSQSHVTSSHHHSNAMTSSGNSNLKDVEGYVGFANLPNQVYRKAVKRGFEFTLMVVGEWNYIIIFL